MLCYIPVVNTKTRLTVLAIAGAALAAGGCAHGPPAVPGGATEAAVFFTPDVRAARAAAGHVFASQHSEYARRDSAVGVRRPSARADLYPPSPGYRSTYRIEETRVTASDDGYRVRERTSESVYRGHQGHRRR